MIGFKGNARLIFKGLTTPIINKVKREAFDYLLAVSSSCNTGAVRHGPIKELQSWVKREIGTPEDLVEMLAFTTGSELPLAAFALRIASLGFDGDVMALAVKMSRGSGGNVVT